MNRKVRAIFRNGEIEPLDLPENARLKIIIEDVDGKGQPSADAGAADPMARIYEIAEDIGPADLATNLDHYLYGLPKVE
jgi:hypothetical protein